MKKDGRETIILIAAGHVSTRTRKMVVILGGTRPQMDALTLTNVSHLDGATPQGFWPVEYAPFGSLSSKLWDP